VRTSEGGPQHMSAHGRAEFQHLSTSGLGQALYFDSGGKTLFGWLHRPAQIPPPTMGLVICNPFGFEATCAHRSVRVFAETAASLGIPALRFDYLGTGDSADIEPNADQLEVWAQDVLAAIDELRRSTRVEHVCLMGIRLGALLATLASRRSDRVRSVILIAPIVSGARYLRELRTIRLAAALALNPTSSIAADQSASTPMDVSGFPISGATLGSLSTVDLAGSDAPAPHTLIIDGDKVPVAAEWARRLAGKGHTKYLALPGLHEMIMRSALRAAVPQAMVGAMREWLQELHAAYAASAARPIALVHSAGLAEPIPAVLTLAGDSPAKVVSTERPVFIAADTMLFGIVTEPRQEERRRRGMILLNTGADNHIGANRMHVALARRWARDGYVVLRLDLGGLGDSGTRIGGVDDEVFPAAAVEEIRAAIDFLRSRYNVDSLALGGVCSGAYHALRAAAAGLPINGIFMINPQNYYWHKGMRIDDLQLVEVVRYPTVYLRRIFTRDAWRKLLAGDVSIIRILSVYVHRSLLTIESAAREFARRAKLRLPNDLGTELEEIAGRGIRVVFVFAKNEPGLTLLKLQGGTSIEKIGDRCRIHVIDGGDHIFSQRIHREAMADVLTKELQARPAPAVRS
jgi:alpha-beta hydrolase superfamily lysophospholipase